MAEFHQKEEQGRSADQPVNTAHETPDGDLKNNLKKAIPPAPESSKPTAEIEAETASSPVKEVPYERLQQGPITYFRYYFEDAQQPTYLTSPTTELSPGKRNLLPLYLAGGGVLGATLISGFVIAGLANNSKAPAQKGTTDSKVKQTPTPRLIQPQVASPEVVPPSRSTPTKRPQTPKKAPPKAPSLPTVRSSLDLPQALMVPAPLPVPALPVVSVPIARAVSNPLPAPVAPPRVAPVMPPIVETPTALPSVKPFSPELASADSSPKPPDFAPAPLAAKESAQLPTAADARCLSSGATPEESLTAQNQQVAPSSRLVSAPETVGMPSANRQPPAEATVTGTVPSLAIVADGETPVTSLQNAEKDLQEFLELPQRFPSSAGIAVMPLPCQVAQTAITKQRVADFNVIRLGAQDYQKRWKLSSNNPQALVPIYGFIDYKQQSVVLLSAREEKVSQL